MKNKRNIVPSLFTMLNLFFGFFAVINIFQEKFVTASWLIILAAVWDGMDGKIARKTSTFTEFGIQFDTLADVISFCMAPSILMYQVFFYRLGPSGVILSFFPLLFGAIRLARFNVSQEGFEKENFTGLPTPLMAGTLATYIIFNYDLWNELKFEPLLIPLVLFVSILMVTNVEYETLPKFSFKADKKNSVMFLLILFAVAIIAIFRQKVMFPMVFGFVLYYMFRSIWHSHKEEDEEEVLDISISD